MANENMQIILDKIKEYEKIIIFRHFRPDGDAIGSSKGLQEILKVSFSDKKIYLQNSDFSDYLAFLGGEDAPLLDEEYTDALGIVLDTSTAKRISNQKYSLCKELIKIDHHIPVEESYANHEWVEENRSSCCEMIAHFYNTFKDCLKINSKAATYVYTGMVTDSGRFRYRDVSGETLRLAGIMLDCGIETDVLYANLYLKDLNAFKFESVVHQKMKMTENGVLYMYVPKKMQKKLGLTFEEACTCVGYMDSVKNSLIWLAFIEGDDGVLRVRLRSRFVTVNELAEQYNGGGHAYAAGASVHSKKEMNELIAKADEILKKYKKENEGWL